MRSNKSLNDSGVTTRSLRGIGLDMALPFT
jgi:hypothetical protein